MSDMFPDIPSWAKGGQFDESVRQRAMGTYPWPRGPYDPVSPIKHRLRLWRFLTWVVLPIWCGGFVWVAVGAPFPHVHSTHQHDPYTGVARLAMVVVLLLVVLCALKIRKVKGELREARQLLAPPPGVISAPPGWRPGNSQK
jgi:apolipoprotein N-acyltransferase